VRGGQCLPARCSDVFGIGYELYASATHGIDVGHGNPEFAASVPGRDRVHARQPDVIVRVGARVETARNTAAALLPDISSSTFNGNPL
jgi:hypothetical protein